MVIAVPQRCRGRPESRATAATGDDRPMAKGPNDAAEA